jgi:hypothetical protein
MTDDWRVRCIRTIVPTEERVAQARVPEFADIPAGDTR